MLNHLKTTQKGVARENSNPNRQSGEKKVEKKLTFCTSKINRLRNKGEKSGRNQSLGG